MATHPATIASQAGGGRGWAQLLCTTHIYVWERPKSLAGVPQQAVLWKRNDPGDLRPPTWEPPHKPAAPGPSPGERRYPSSTRTPAGSHLPPQSRGGSGKQKGTHQPLLLPPLPRRRHCLRNKSPGAGCSAHFPPAPRPGKECTRAFPSSMGLCEAPSRAAIFTGPGKNIRSPNFYL